MNVELLNEIFIDSDLIETSKIICIEEKEVDSEDISLISDIKKIELYYDSADESLPESVIMKSPKSSEMNQVFDELGFYSNEINFYKYVKNGIEGVLVPKCFYISEKERTLLLENVSYLLHGSQIDGCCIEVAIHIIKKLAIYHKSNLNNCKLETMFCGWNKKIVEQEKVFFSIHWENVKKMYLNILDDEIIAIGNKLEDIYIDLWMNISNRNNSLLHFDLRLDNIFWNDKDVMLIDWQLARWGNVAYDVSLFIVGNLSIDDRRKYGESLLKCYYEIVFNDIDNISYEDFMFDYICSLACHFTREINYLGENGYGEQRKDEYAERIFVRFLSAMKDYDVWSDLSKNGLLYN